MIFTKFDCPICEGRKCTTAFVCGPKTGGVREIPCQTCKATGWLTDGEMGVYRLKKAKHEERRNARLARNLSMREMAKEMRVSLADYSSYEHGRIDL